MTANNKLLVAPILGVLLFSLSGCTMNSRALSAFSTTNSADTGKFKSAKITYENGDTKCFSNVEVYPYNNGGDDSTGGRLEIRKDKSVYVIPNNAQIDLKK